MEAFAEVWKMGGANSLMRRGSCEGFFLGFQGVLVLLSILIPFQCIHTALASGGIQISGVRNHWLIVGILFLMGCSVLPCIPEMIVLR
jgi:hypothetical protein